MSTDVRIVCVLQVGEQTLMFRNAGQHLEFPAARLQLKYLDLRGVLKDLSARLSVATLHLGSDQPIVTGSGTQVTIALNVQARDGLRITAGSNLMLVNLGKAQGHTVHPNVIAVDTQFRRRGVPSVLPADIDRKYLMAQLTVMGVSPHDAGLLCYGSSEESSSPGGAGGQRVRRIVVSR